VGIYVIIREILNVLKIFTLKARLQQKLWPGDEGGGIKERNHHREQKKKEKSIALKLSIFHLFFIFLLPASEFLILLLS